MDIFLKKFVKNNFNRIGSALDLGCGEGFDIAGLKHLGWDAKGVDLPESDLNKPYSDSRQHDLVYSNYVFPFVLDKEMFVSNLYENLKPDGRIFVATFSDKDEVFRTKGISPDKLEGIFAGKFEDIEISEHDFYDNDEGHHHWHKLLILSAKKRR